MLNDKESTRVHKQFETLIILAILLTPQQLL